MKTILFRSLSVLVAVNFLASQMFYTRALAQNAADDQEQANQEGEKKTEDEKGASATIDVVTGNIHIINTKDLRRVSVANPDVADISDAKPENVFIVGKKAGQTVISVWDESGKRTFTVRVASENLSELKAQLEDILSKAGIKGAIIDKNSYEGKLEISGALVKKDKDALEKILEPFSEKIMNLVTEDINEDMIEIDAQVLEINATLDRTLGIDWYTGTITQNDLGFETDLGENPALSPIYLEKFPSQDGSVGDYFKIGKFYRATNTAFAARINAILANSEGRVVSRPRLITKNGKEASFNVGGEIPIKTTTASSGGGTIGENVTFKQYGVNMTVTPTIQEGNKINVALNVQVSDIDTATPLGTFSGDSIAFVTRQAQTEMLLEDRQTIVMAGFIKHNTTNSVRKVAFLGDIPILGLLFRSHSTPIKDTEMVIILTPHIIKTKKLVDQQTDMNSKRLKELAKEVDNNFDKEPLVPKEKTSAPQQESMKQEPAKAQESVQSAPNPVYKAPDAVIFPYIRSIQLKISKAIAYPPEAIKNNWDGSVKLRLHILKNGTLAHCDLLESSGHDVFDQNALETARAVAPFASFPAEMAQDDVVVSVPIVYNQHAAQEGTQTVVASY